MVPDRNLSGQWATRIAGGDEVAFEQLFHAYRDDLCRYACAFTKSWEAAEDLVGEVFLGLWRQREKLEAVRDLHAYLYTTVRFTALDYIRHAKVEQRWQAEHVNVPPPVDGAPSSVDRLLTEEATAIVVRAIDELPDRQRDVMRRRLEGQSYQAIADGLDISLKTVEVHVTRAIARLRKVLPQLFE